MGATLRDIAKACDMDVSTVSRALRGDTRVKAETRDRIRAVADDLGYHPNLAARSLVAGKTKTIWFILPSLSNPREQASAAHATSLLREHGYDVLIAIYEGKWDLFARLIRRMHQGVTDGAIIVPGPPDQELFEPLIKTNWPMVFLDRYVEGVGAPSVSTDNFGCAKRLVELCLDSGAESFFVIQDTGNPVERARREGAITRIEEAGLPYAVGDCEAHELEELPGKIGVISSSEGNTRIHVQKHASTLKGRQMVCATYDIWSGEPYPAEKVFVCIQDFHQMAAIAVDQILELIQGKQQLQGRVFDVPPVDFITIEPSF